MTAAQAQPATFERPLALIGLLAVGAFPTFLITVTVGSIGVSFLLSGVAVFVAGVMGLTGALPVGLQMHDSPIKAVMIGPVLAAAGAIALAGLVGYFWLAAKAIRRLLPARTP